MNLLEWTPDLDTGIETIDVQHRQIVRYINDLYDAKTSGGSEEKLLGVIENIVQYTVYHFEEEERMLGRANYPLLHTHKRIHHEFIDKLANILDDFKASKDVSEALMNLLRSWLFNHIRIHDKGYVTAVKRSGADLG